MLDGPVLPCRVHGLQDDEDRVPVVGVEKRLGLGKVGKIDVENLAGSLLDHVFSEGAELGSLLPRSLMVLQPKLPTWFYDHPHGDRFSNKGGPANSVGRKGRAARAPALDVPPGLPASDCAVVRHRCCASCN